MELKNEVSVILNCYKRPHVLEKQLNAIKNQSIKPKEILIWVNGSDQVNNFNFNILNSCKTAISNYNHGVWARFAYALNAESDYVCIFDDDTIPGSRWLENCLNESKHKHALYGTVGVIFHDLDYQKYQRFGWPNPNENPVKVDIVGHSWFFPKYFLSTFFKETEAKKSSICGEDVHFSYSIQKYLGAETIVPAHPVNNKELWGSTPEDSYKYGVDENAISVNYHGSHFGESLKHYHNKGFKLISL